jgi:cell wall integrity and stress response component
MPSIRSALAASIFALATSVSAQSSVQTASATNSPKAVQTLGCYSGLDSTFVNQGPWTFQSSGYCQIVCSNQFKNVMATSQGSNCYCGDHIPASNKIVDNSTCNSACNGYDQQDCGGDTTFTVYLSGLSTDVETDGSSSSSAKPSSTSNGGSSSAGGSPSVITKAGQTIVVTASSTANNQSSGGSSKVGIAVGVVVGVLAIAAIVGGLIFFMKQRRRRAVEEEYKRNAANAEFIRQKSGKSETSSTTDNRLDQAATFTHRRQSIGSIADENDFSRRILQVSISTIRMLTNANMTAGAKPRWRLVHAQSPRLFL